MREGNGYKKQSHQQTIREGNGYEKQNSQRKSKRKVRVQKTEPSAKT